MGNLMKNKFYYFLLINIISALIAYAQQTEVKKKVKKAPKPPKVLIPPTAEELKKVEVAVLSAQAQEPKQERKILVYSQSHGFKHNSRLIGEEMLKIIEQKPSG